MVCSVSGLGAIEGERGDFLEHAGSSERTVVHTDRTQHEFSVLRHLEGALAWTRQSRGIAGWNVLSHSRISSLLHC